MSMEPKKKGPFRVLVFDLDDTLLDTWGQLVAPAAREACAAMIATGLDTELDACVRERERLFLAHPGCDVYDLLVARFGVLAGADGTAVREAGHEAYFNRDVTPNIRPFEKVPHMLAHLGRLHLLYLVTSGHPATQQQKVAHLRLGPHFRSIHYVDNRAGVTKSEVFAQLLAKATCPPAAFLIIGDRLDREIRAGKALGMATCHVHRGEFSHLQPSDPLEQPDYRIGHIHELTDLLRRLVTS